MVGWHSAWRDRLLVIVAVALAHGCGDDTGPVDGGPTDGGPPDAMPFVIEAPAPPVLTPCPTGWREDATEEPSVCVPWPQSGRAECTGVEAHFPGEAGCTAIGTSCPATDFPDDAPAGAVFVLAGAVDGDGSRASPYGSIGAAVRVATFDSTIVIGPGTYDENVTLTRRLTLRGVCPERTVLTSTAALGPTAVVDVVSTEVTLENLSIRDAERIAIFGEQEATVHVDSVLVDGDRFIGLAVSDGSHLDARNVIVRGMRPRTDGRFGRGVDIEAGGTAEIRRAVVQGARSEAVFVADEGSAVVLEDAALLGTLPQESDSDFGHGLAVQSGASAEVRRVVASDNRGVAIGAFFEGTRLLLEDAVLSGTRVYDAGGTSGFGLAVQDGASAEARRILVLESAESHVMVQAATLTLEDAVLRDATGRPDGTNGRGVQTQDDALLELHRVAIQRAREVGLQFVERSMVSGDDILISDMQSDVGTGGRARGIGFETASTANLARVRVVGVREVGVVVFHAGTRAMLTDLEVSDTLRADCVDTTCPETAVGSGLGSYQFGALVARDFLVERSELCGVQVAEDAALDLASGVIADSLLGACVQIEGYDLTRLTEDVDYRDNETSLDSTSLPVPAPVAGLGS